MKRGSSLSTNTHGKYRGKEERGDGVYREAAGESLIRRYYKLIEASDAVLIVNAEKKGVSGYIGANTFLEIGFAHVLDKKIYLLNLPAPGSYNDEIKEINPVIINGDYSLIK